MRIVKVFSAVMALLIMCPVVCGIGGNLRGKNKMAGSAEVSHSIGDLALGETKAYLAYDRNNLYIGVECPKTERPVVEDHVWEGDSIEIFIDTNFDRKTYCQLVTNSVGATFEQRVLQKELRDRLWDPRWQVKTKVKDNGWIAEIAIPFKEIGMSTPEVGDVWGLNIVVNKQKGDSSRIKHWAVTDKSNHEPARFGYLCFSDGERTSKKRQEFPKVSVGKLKKNSPVIDGELDDECWKNAPVLNFAMNFQQIKPSFRGYWEAYPAREDIRLESVEKKSFPDGIEIKLVLNSGQRDFSHFMYSIDGKHFKKIKNEYVIVRFKKAKQSIRKVVLVKAVSRSGDSSKTYAINVSYFSKEYYEAKGASESPRVVVNSSVLRFPAPSVESFASKLTSQEKAYAQKKWGKVLGNTTSDYEKAKLLAKLIIDGFEGHTGTPSDELKGLSPFEQYERISSGKDKGWCVNMATIFAHACNAFEIPARSFHIGYRIPSSDEYALLFGAHRTSEIFSNDLNQWIWMDISFCVLGTYLGEEGPLNMSEFYLFLNQDHRKKRLRILCYDPKTKTEKILPVDECPKDFFKAWAQPIQFCYMAKGR